MTLFRSLQPGQRLASLHRLALLLLALLAAVALFQADRLGRMAGQAEQELHEGANLVHGLARQVDDGRGLEALHLAQHSAAQQKELEAALQRQRQRLQALLTRAAASRSAQELAYLQAVEIRLGLYWAVQDQLLLASRQAREDASLAPQARALLNGDSLGRYRAVIEALETWWRHRDEVDAAAAQQSRSQAAIWLRAGLVLQLGVLALLALPAGLAWRRRQAARSGSQASPDPTKGGAEPELSAAQLAMRQARRAARHAQEIAMRAQLLALNATVQAARAGGRSADLDAVADQAHALAVRCAAAADADLDAAADSALDPSEHAPADGQR